MMGVRSLTLTITITITITTTPAEAGAHLGDDGDDELRAVTATFPIGPRPPPGWWHCGWGAPLQGPLACTAFGILPPHG